MSFSGDHKPFDTKKNTRKNFSQGKFFEFSICGTWNLPCQNIKKKKIIWAISRIRNESLGKFIRFLFFFASAVGTWFIPFIFPTFLRSRCQSVLYFPNCVKRNWKFQGNKVNKKIFPDTNLTAQSWILGSQLSSFSFGNFATVNSKEAEIHVYFRSAKSCY
jgi:hypothetical protein